MAKATFTSFIEGMNGRLGGKDGVIFRRKAIRDEKGNIISLCKPEVYKIVNPRNFKQTPMVGKEKEHTELWAEACRRATQESKPGHERYTYWRKRWEAQLKKADALAPMNKNTKKPKIYHQFNCFVRVGILWELQGKEKKGYPPKQP